MTMIEKVAEALFMEASKDRFGKWPTITEEARLLWRKSAKVAIEVMREPTHEMIDIFIEEGHAGGLEIYNKMIDAALKEG